MSRTVLVLFVVVFCLGCTGNKTASNQVITSIPPISATPNQGGFAHDRGKEKFSQRNQTEVLARRGGIRSELETLKDHPWAGFYSHGGFPGAVRHLAVAPNAGFAYTCRSTDVYINGALALYDQNYGEVVWENGRLKLFPVLENEEDDTPLPTEFVLIPWGDQLCLIPADGIIDFCNRINAGFGGTCFVRDGYFGMPRPVGRPEVPDEFKPYLLDVPIEGELIVVGEPREFRKRSSIVCETVVVVNRGRQDGVLPGMTFHVTNPENIFAPIKLTKISDTESEGIIEQGLHHSMVTGERSIGGGSPQVGWTVSTRFQ